MTTRLRFVEVFSIVLIVLALSAVIVVTADFLEKPTLHELQREHDAYRVCMQSASRVGCSMTPADFVRYYQIEDQIRVMSEDL